MKGLFYLAVTCFFVLTTARLHRRDAEKQLLRVKRQHIDGLHEMHNKHARQSQIVDTTGFTVKPTSQSVKEHDLKEGIKTEQKTHDKHKLHDIKLKEQPLSHVKSKNKHKDTILSEQDLKAILEDSADKVQGWLDDSQKKKEDYRQSLYRDIDRAVGHLQKVLEKHRKAQHQPGVISASQQQQQNRMSHGSNKKKHRPLKYSSTVVAKNIKDDILAKIKRDAIRLSRDMNKVTRAQKRFDGDVRREAQDINRLRQAYSLHNMRNKAMSRPIF